MPEVRASDKPLCDFCSEPKPQRRFEVPDFPMDKSPGMPEYRSKGAWMACSTCGTLIDEQRWPELLDRAVAALAPKYHALMPNSFLRETVKRSHDLFREHYKP